MGSLGALALLQRGEVGALHGEAAVLHGEAAVLRGEVGALRGEAAALKARFETLPAPPPAPPPPPAGIEERLQALVEKAAPALLHIENREFGGVGSGFVVDDEGRALTNAHVVNEARTVKVMLWNGLRAVAKVVGRDYVMDLALVQLDLRNEDVKRFVRPLPMGDASRLRVGQVVIAMGSPHNLDRSVSFGILSNVRRNGGVLAMPRGVVSGFMNPFLQTDAAINPGNSGGPLVALDGTVVGINSRGYPNADGLGMSIPIEVARGVFEQLKKLTKDQEGQLERNLLGVELVAFDPGEDEEPWAYKLEKGAKVRSVFPDSPAAGAGIEKGDVITRVGGKEVGAPSAEDVPAVYREIDRFKPGEEFEVELQRGEAKVVKVKGVSSLAFRQSIRIDPIGIYARAPYEDEVRGGQGAVVTSRIEPFPGFDREAEDQFQVGDVVKKIDGIPVRSFEAFYDQIRSAAGPVPAKSFEVIRGRRTVEVAFPFQKKAKRVEDGGD